MSAVEHPESRDSNRMAQSSPGIPCSLKAPQGQGRREGGTLAPMGLREQAEQISTLHKQNFDLKMEVYHRREKMAALEKRLEEIEALEADNAELHSINDELLQELEKRDCAVEEAVAIICDLERKLEEWEQAPTGSTTVLPDCDYQTTAEGGIPPSSPPALIARSVPQTPAGNRVSHSKSHLKSGLSAIPPHLVDLATPVTNRTAPRVPSFLHSEIGSHGALRSLYLSGENEYRQGHDETPSSRRIRRADSVSALSDDLHSPRLSVLSESSFMSIYGNGKPLRLSSPSERQSTEDATKQLEDCSKLDHVDAVDTRQSSARSVERWMEAREEQVNPKKKSSKTSEKRTEELLEVQDVPKRVAPTPVLPKSRSYDLQPQSVPDQEIRSSPLRKWGESISMGAPMFASSYLPPTPDTMSTIDQEGWNGSASVTTEKSLLDGSPAPFRQSTALDPRLGISSRPSWTRDTSFDRDDLDSLDGEAESAYAGDVIWGQYATSPHLHASLSRDMMFNGEGSDRIVPRHEQAQASTPTPLTPLTLTDLSRSTSHGPGHRRPHSSQASSSTTPGRSRDVSSTRTETGPASRPTRRPSVTTRSQSSYQHPTATLPSNYSRTVPTTPTTSNIASRPLESSHPSMTPISTKAMDTVLASVATRAAPLSSPAKKTNSLKARLFGRSAITSSSAIASEAVSASSTPPRTPRHHRTFDTTNASSRLQVQDIARNHRSGAPKDGGLPGSSIAMRDSRSGEQMSSNRFIDARGGVEAIGSRDTTMRGRTGSFSAGVSGRKSAAQILREEKLRR